MSVASDLARSLAARGGWIDLSHCELTALPDLLTDLLTFDSSETVSDRDSERRFHEILMLLDQAEMHEGFPNYLLDALSDIKAALERGEHLRSEPRHHRFDDEYAWILAALGEIEESVRRYAADSASATASVAAQTLDKITAAVIDTTQGRFTEARQQEVLQLLMDVEVALTAVVREATSKLISEFQSSETLDLSDNLLTTLHPSIRNLYFLENLYCANNAFRDLPTHLADLESLRHLDLSGNEIDEITSIIGGLIHLDTLVLEGNRIGRISPAIAALESLTHLLAARNHLQEIPTTITGLSNLEMLDLSGNGLQEVPAEISRLSRLEGLSLSDNELETLPEGLGSLSNLRFLDLSYNRLTTVPADLANAPLEYLNLSSNDLETLPPQLGDLPTTVELHLDDNPLSDTIWQAADRGTEALFAYLRSLREITHPCREAKLVLVGEGNVGKTSLVAALREEPFVRDRSTTHGIEIRKMTLDGPDGTSPITFNTWDFGGQKIYRITHQFFFSQEGVYLLVWRPREGLEQNGVDYWLRRIWHRVGTRARVILVSTYADEGRQSHIDFERLRHDFHPLIVEWLQVDNETGRGIPELREAIARHASSLSHINDPIAESWMNVARRLETLTDSFIDRRVYDDICSEHGLDSRASDAWLGLLHDLGLLIYFTHDIGLSSFIVLDPEMLTKAASYVVEDTRVAQNGGILEHSTLKRIWGIQKAGQPVFPPHTHPYLLRLMEKYEISYRLDNREASLIAPTVPPERPLLPWEPGDRIAPETVQMSMKCRLAGEAPGLISWILVRNHRWATDVKWNEGVLLRNVQQRAEALIEENERELSVHVRAAYPNEMFSVIRSELEWLIQDRWANLDYTFFVPCSQFTRGNGCRGEFAFDSLVKATERGFRNIQCPQCFENRDVAQLMTGFRGSAPSRDKTLQQIHETLDKLDRRMVAQSTATEQARDAAERTGRLTGEVATLLRRMREAINLQASDSPRLFTLFPIDTPKVRASRLWREKYGLRLWCEHPGEEHPTRERYEFTRDKQWFVRVRPIVTTMVRVMRLVPVVSTASDVVGPGGWAGMREEIRLMEKLTIALDEFAKSENIKDLPTTALVRPEGFELRVLKELLKEIDPPPQRFAGLRRVPGIGGEIYWVCPFHYAQYDQGLPELP